MIYDLFMDQTIDTPTALATSSSAQDIQADFDCDNVNPSQLTLGSMQHCFFYMRTDTDPLHGEGIEGRLTKDNFVRPVHGVLFEKLREMHDLGLEVEIMQLINVLHQCGLLAGIGGAYVVITFYYFAYTVNSCEKYFSQPEHRNELRTIIEACASSPSNPLVYHSIGQGDPAAQELELRNAVADVLEHFKQHLADDMAAFGRVESIKQSSPDTETVST